MIKVAQIGLLLALVLGAFNQAKAALLLEPVLGYTLGSVTELQDSTTLDNEDRFTGSGLSYGGRFGFQQLGFQIGADYLRSSIDTSDSVLDEDLVMSEWAGFVGFEFPVLLRVYAGYIFTANGTSKNGADDVEFNKGTGSKVGLGFTGLPFIDINLEYRAGKFKEFEAGATKVDVDTTYRAYMISLSLPFTL